METHFNHKRAEAKIRVRWENSQAFLPQGNGKPFAILIPPPNVTGVLHMGHALNNSLQDILCRLARMRGRKVLWQPGMDHAGIATQMVVERHLASQGKPDRRSLGRQEFVEQVWSWKEQSGNTIIEQLKRLGASCDWSRSRFTLDEGFSKAVREVFVRLHQEGLIYRERRLVNWDPHFQTALSDLEVESRETPGHFWHFKYPLQNGQSYDFPTAFDKNGLATAWEKRDYVAIATTRPETMLGDAAVAVHPDDSRYQNAVGAKLLLPIAERSIPLIADSYPDPAFGSGAVKITGAHDFNDFQVARRHELPLHDIMDDSGRLAGAVPDRYRGMDRFKAREAIVAEMETLGLLLKTEERTIQQPFGDRSGSVIEPRLKEQWFVDAKTLASPAIKAVENNEIRFVPENWKNTYFEWMRNIEPWCISRQLWWGHRIPAWYDDQGQVYVARCKQDAQKQAAPDTHLRQDEDVLDTWFSSALWPFATLGWPDTENEALREFYPSTVLVTGFDIIFFWVARMIMQSLHFMGKPPFPEIHVHALVRDAKGQKMSKSKGNTIDPLALIDKYGADSLRFTLAAMAVPGRDIKLSEQRLAGYRNFSTKLWNAARFCQMRTATTIPDGYEPHRLSQTINRWIVSQIRRCADNIVHNIDSGRFHEAANTIYRFIWNVFCDWYLEMVKPQLAETPETTETRATLGWSLHQCLKMLHPFMPYITEELWDELGNEGLLMLQGWPDLREDSLALEAEQEMEELTGIITHIRSLRSDLAVPAAEQIEAALISISREEWLEEHGSVIERLARLSSLKRLDDAPENWVKTSFGDSMLALNLTGHIDREAQIRRLQAEISKKDKGISAIEKKLSNPQFCRNAPEEIVSEQKERLETALAERDRLQAALQSLQEAS